jgi:hypothetical protein
LRINISWKALEMLCNVLHRDQNKIGMQVILKCPAKMCIFTPTTAAAILGPNPSKPHGKERENNEPTIT